MQKKSLINVNTYLLDKLNNMHRNMLKARGAILELYVLGSRTSLEFC